MEQLTIFDDLPIFKFDKKNITIIETFAGVGSFSLALKDLNIEFKTIGFSEIDKYAITTYKSLHGENINNLGNIAEIYEFEKCDILTWSPPCQDISTQGLLKGLVHGTRSSLIYEIPRILKNTKIENLPKVLIMENVPNLANYTNEMAYIQHQLEQTGYNNYVEFLKASDYGTPQMRIRYFMISILGDYNFKFPNPIPLKKTAWDLVEKGIVHEKYFISQALYNNMTCTKKRGKSQYVRNEKFTVIDENTKLFRTQTTRNKTVQDDYILDFKAKQIREKTPLERFRVMGVADKYYHQIPSSISDSQRIKQAGNMIVVSVLKELLKTLFKD